MGFNQAWIFLTDVLPRAIKKYGGYDPEALRKAALDTDIPVGGTIQGYGVKFFPPGTRWPGRTSAPSPVVMQYVNGETKIVWPTAIKTADPVLPAARRATPTRAELRASAHRGDRRWSAASACSDARQRAIPWPSCPSPA